LGQSLATFRDGQWESIEQLLNRRRVLVVQRTGWGKNMVYFLATKLLREQGAGPMLLNNEIKALVATVALGMGFDKPDMGFVIHFQRPASVVHYLSAGWPGRACGG